MIKHDVLLIAVILLHFNLFSQVITRRGSAEWIEQQGKIQTKKAPAKYSVSNDALKVKLEKLSVAKDFSNIIGADIAVPLNLFEQGKVEDVNDSLSIVTMGIESTNAHFLALIFSEFRIPESDEMYIYNRTRTVLMGPFTSKNNPSGGLYATDIIEGDNLIVEYHKKRHSSAKGSISISKVIHGLNPQLLDNASVTNTSGNDCLVDANCAEGSGWDDQKSGTCLILKLGDPSNPNTSGTLWASAALLNNTRQDNTPYIFTAWHNTQGTGSNLDLWIFRFKYWRNTCNGTINSITVSYCGGQMLEAWENDGSNNDVALLKMHELPNYADNLYYCGWSRSTSTPTSSVLISHPQGGSHLMKIAKSNTVSDAGLWWRSQWYVGGATSGSSGAPLFDGNKRVIGAHHGRYSTDCNADASAGKLSFSWNTLGKGGYKIGKWLDPNNTGVTTLDGKKFCTTTNFINQTVTTNITVTGCDVNVQNTTITNGATLTINALGNVYIQNVTVINGARLTIKARDVDIQQPFDVQLGAELDIIAL